MPRTYKRTLRRVYKRTMYSFWWIPNAISFFRGFFAAPVVAIVYLWELFAHISTTATRPDMLGNYPVMMFYLVLVAAASDAADGYLAKTFERYGWRTDKGGEIDAYCDKFLGLAVLYMAIPLHYRFDWYLILYVPALCYIGYYSQETTRMRQAGLIKKPNKMAQWKTAILMVVKVAIFIDIAYVSSDAILWAGTVATVVAAVMCIYAMEDYKNSAAIMAASARAG